MLEDQKKNMVCREDTKKAQVLAWRRGIGNADDEQHKTAHKTKKSDKKIKGEIKKLSRSGTSS